MAAVPARWSVAPPGIAGRHLHAAFRNENYQQSGARLRGTVPGFHGAAPDGQWRRWFDQYAISAAHTYDATGLKHMARATESPENNRSLDSAVSTRFASAFPRHTASLNCVKERRRGARFFRPGTLVGRDAGGFMGRGRRMSDGPADAPDSGLDAAEPTGRCAQLADHAIPAGGNNVGRVRGARARASRRSACWSFAPRRSRQSAASRQSRPSQGMAGGNRFFAGLFFGPILRSKRRGFRRDSAFGASPQPDQRSLRRTQIERFRGP